MMNKRSLKKMNMDKGGDEKLFSGKKLHENKNSNKISKEGL
jgi:hypothetical protein